MTNPESLLGRAFELLHEFGGGAPTDDAQPPLRWWMRVVAVEFGAARQAQMDAAFRLGQRLFSPYVVDFGVFDIAPAGQTVGELSEARVEVPPLARWGGSVALDYCGSEDGQQPYAQCASREAAEVLATGSRLAAGRPAVFWTGDGLALLLPPEYRATERVRVRGVPGDVSSVGDEEAGRLVIPPDVWSAVKSKIRAEYFPSAAAGQQNRDDKNNASPA